MTRFLDPRSVLSVPAVYRLYSEILAGDRVVRVLFDEHVRAKSGDVVLDIGCGPGDTLEYLPDVEYHGFDLSDAYIRQARTKYGTRGTFTCQDVTRYSLGELEGRCDLVLATGVLHHLDDDAALKLLSTANRALRPGGRLITYDGCYTPQQSFLSRFIVSLDRGRHVRKVRDYEALAAQVFPKVEVNVYHDLLRVPYTHIIMESSSPAYGHVL